jgi:hypothetical protein
MIGNTANLSKAMRAILPLQVSECYKWDYHGGRPCRRLSVDSDAPRTINPVGTKAPPIVSDESSYETPPKLAISRIHSRGGLPSGASGIVIPGTFSTNSALRVGINAISKLNRHEIAGGEIKLNMNFNTLFPALLYSASSGVG